MSKFVEDSVEVDGVARVGSHWLVSRRTRPEPTSSSLSSVLWLIMWFVWFGRTSSLPVRRSFPFFSLLERKENLWCQALSSVGTRTILGHSRDGNSRMIDTGMLHKKNLTETNLGAAWASFNLSPKGYLPPHSVTKFLTLFILLQYRYFFTHRVQAPDAQTFKRYVYVKIISFRLSSAPTNEVKDSNFYP